jgi:1,4-alpha-glucan branching enzyme
MYHGTLHTLLFQYKSNEVCNFLISSAMFFLKEFHVDGLRIGELGGILYLNYGKDNGDYQPNIYGGPENLEGIEFLKCLNQVVKKQVPGIITIAEDTTDWPEVTGNAKNSLGFTYKWNGAFRQDILHYLSFDPYFRSYHHNELTQSMMYHYSEQYIMNYSHDMMIHTDKSVLEFFPGTDLEKLANWKLAIGFLFSHPGKKHLFEMENIETEQLKLYIYAWNQLYRKKSALYSMDFTKEGFEWINEMNHNQCTISFLRKSESGEALLFIANFANILYEKYEVGVEFEGKYKELLNSDQKNFGGENRINKRVLVSRKISKDGRNDSIKLRLAPLSCTILEYQKEVTYEVVKSIV